MLKTYTELLVWQKSIYLVKKIYRITSNFPTEEKFGLCAQIRRSAISIPSNIAEGYGRNSTSDYLRFLCIAMGTLFELETQLYIGSELSYINKADYATLESMVDEVERILTAMRTKLVISKSAK